MTAGPRWRAIFFDRHDADAVAARLTGDGFAAEVVRERLHGEDDEEDQPWAVLTDAPEVMVELLVDAHDGWLDPDGGDPSAGTGAGSPALPPPPLPSAPRTGRGEPDVG